MTKTIILIPSRLGATRLPNKPLLKINNKPIVITAGLEKPDTASEGVRYPNPKKQDSIISAVTSMLKYSLIKRKKPKNKMAITIIISIFIYTLLINYKLAKWMLNIFIY